FRRIRFETNRNFGPGCNAGAQAARGEHLFFLNNDTLLTPGWLEPLLQGLAGKVEAVGPLLLYPPSWGLLGERVQHLGVCCQPSLHVRHLHEFFPASHPLARKRRSLQFITAAALLLRKSVFEQAGMFFEAYANGGEDLDLCVQIMRGGGSVACAPESRIYHLQGQTEGRCRGQGRNVEIFKERCQPFILPDLHLHLEADGYELALNDVLTPFARLPRRRFELARKAFCREGPAPGEEACRSMMEREPVFEPAYEGLAEILEQADRLEELVQLRFLQSRLFPSLASGRRLRQAAQAAGDADMALMGEDMVQRREQMDEDGSLASEARETARFARELGQPNLSRKYRQWLEDEES
ncbi:MAG: glycosyltransferase, partial [Desulfovibrionaceae bacterium]